ncbi:cytochrome P450, partial [Streptomyces sp. NPDC059525]|uniref:cytochrome P450 n=1 Tax=Streptomyces sp. NPDC059525 TaxID=3346857 RepID=UPI0036945B9A
FHGWAMDLSLILALDCDARLRSRVEECLAGLSSYVEALVRERAAGPGGGDVISCLLRAREDGILAPDELRTLVVQLMVAGTHTTSRQLGLAMVAFASHPEQWTRLRDRPDLVEGSVDEILRWCPTTATIGFPRVAADDLLYQGLRIPAGTNVWLGVHAANRDPRVHTDADTFDIGAVRREAPLLNFGGGSHHCPGALLARTELTEALTQLTAALGPPEITGPIRWRPPLGNIGPETLPLRFRP